MALLRGIVEKILEKSDEYIIARCHQSVRFDHSTFDFKFTKDLKNIKEGYTWILSNNFGETIKINKTEEDIKMIKEFNDNLNELIKKQRK